MILKINNTYYLHTKQANIMNNSVSDATIEQHKPTVLIVDDIPDNLTLLYTLLKDTYNVKVANNGFTALTAIKNGIKPDIILLDILMPELSGYDVLDALKMDPNTRHIPVIFLTSMDEEMDEKYGLELGAIDYISKPISAPIVLSHIKAHLENSTIIHSFAATTA